MKKYQYQIVRYIHDRVTSEFVNVGIIVFQQDSKFLGAKFASKFSRVSQFFSDVNGHSLIHNLKNIEKTINELSKTTNQLFFNFTELSEITNKLFPKDDSAIFFTEVDYGIDLSPEIALEDLFDRLVVKYIVEV